MFGIKKKIMIGIVLLLLGGGIMVIVHQHDKSNVTLDENAPIIECITPSNVLVNTKFNDDDKIVIEGVGLNNVIGIYVNGIYNMDYLFDNESGDKVYLNLSEELFDEEKDISIQIETRDEEGQSHFSNEKILKVLSLDTISHPNISNIEPKNLTLDGGSVQWLSVSGDNFNKDSQILLNNEALYTIYDVETGKLLTKLEYSDWCTKDCLQISVGQCYNGFLTEVKSNAVAVDVEANSEKYCLKYDWVKEHYISHAFGAIGDKTYTNTLEAFNENYDKGARLFEVDFSLSADGVLICRHDWSRLTYGRAGEGYAAYEINNLPKTWEDISSSSNDFTMLSFDDVCELLEKYEDIYIITDTKDINSVAIDYVFRYMVEHAKDINEDILKRIVVQVYNEEMYWQIMSIYPFESIIYTLYQTTASEDEVVEFVKETGIKVVTMFPERAAKSTVDRLHELGCMVYVHTINDVEQIEQLAKRGIYGYYTDFLTKQNCAVDIDELNRDYFIKANLCSISNIEDYLEYLAKTDYLVLISVKDDATSGLSERIKELLKGVGAKYVLENFRESYILVAKNKNNIFESWSLDECLTYDDILEDNSISIASGGLDAGNVSVINVNGNDYSMDSRGMNLVVYDLRNNELVDSVNFDFYSGGIFTRRELESKDNNNYQKLLYYLKNVKNERYIVAFSVRDEASVLMTDEIRECLSELGFDNNVLSGYRHSFIGILNGSECVYQEYGNIALSYDMILDGIFVHVESSGNEVGDYSSIQFDGKECSKNSRGLNIAVYDKLLGYVIDSICFDLYSDYNIVN